MPQGGTSVVQPGVLFLNVYCAMKSETQNLIKEHQQTPKQLRAEWEGSNPEEEPNSKKTQ
jgi:hypothetical protein